jgi:hypothetical protein
MDNVTAGENISIVDLRQPMDIEAFPQMFPGALHKKHFERLKTCG